MMIEAVRRISGTLLRMAALLALSSAASAQSISISGVQVSEKDGVQYLDARVHYEFSDAMRDALYNGVALSFVLDIELFRSRDYIWDEAVTSLHQRYYLSHQPLTRNFLVSNANSGAQHILPTLEVALSVMGTVVRLPLIDSNLLDDQANYYGRLRARLDSDELPIPLRLQTYLYLAPEWRLTSDWYPWTLQR